MSMTSLMNADPWNFLEGLWNGDSRLFRDVQARATGRFPPVNVFLDDDAVLIDLQLPGKSAKDVSLTLEPQAVVIADLPAAPEGAAQDANPVQPAWSRRIELPFRIEEAKASAKFTNGILRIELPKAEKTGVRRIVIEG